MSGERSALTSAHIQFFCLLMGDFVLPCLSGALWDTERLLNVEEPAPTLAYGAAALFCLRSMRKAG